jgi:hypothetical protein
MTLKQRLPPKPVRQAQIRDNASAGAGSWTRNSLLSEFTGIHAGIGRAFRSFGRLIDDPLDNFIGRRELRRLRRQLDQLSAEEWAIFPELFHADLCVKRVVECVRYASFMTGYTSESS